MKYECHYEEEAKERYKPRLMAGERVDAYEAAVDIMRAVLRELDLFDGERGYHKRYPDGSMSFGDWGSFWYVEFRYRAAQIYEDQGAEAAERYIRAQLQERL